MDDFERRRELRRQKREEMRLEAERLAYQRNDDDEEEAARERRRRARQERLRNKDDDEPTILNTDKAEVNNQNSLTEDEPKNAKETTATTEEDSALLEKLARREERRQKRLQEAMERQREFDPTISDHTVTTTEEIVEVRRGRYGEEDVEEKTEIKTYQYNDWREKEEEKREEEKVEEPVQEEEEEEAEEEEQVEEEPQEKIIEEMKEEIEENQKLFRLREEKMNEKPKRSFMREEEAIEEKPKKPLLQEEIKEEKVTREKEVDSIHHKNKEQSEMKHQNGDDFYEDTSNKYKKIERSISVKSNPETEEQDAVARLEAERKLEELRRRRDETESEEFEKLRLKQQEAEVELEELKRKREERRKILEEEEERKKQEEAEKKAKEEEEKRRMKEEIERRRAEAAEKRQKIAEDSSSDGQEKKPFKCVSPRGSSLKIGERAEFLNKSTQKSVKASHAPVVSKIDNKLEQYTTAVQTHKETKSAKPAAADLPVVGEGVRNIKNLWEKGDVFSTGGNPGTPNKETAGLKVGVASRINEWLTKTPESNKAPGGKPADLKAGDVTNKRSLWENKASSPEKSSSSAKVAVGRQSKSVTNAGMGHLP
ncbi:caldesmon 1a isoform X4 [Erpetoichthys calabaricus]|uniref:caldesmon 1a isoform X4 n=1 Tax=Erpetoichthys calabaricus TaxID=27687 RepID=UPI00109F461E|nr:caldesmon 1a isoform X4 [Erpetoichthys calabaricus]